MYSTTVMGAMEWHTSPYSLISSKAAAATVVFIYFFENVVWQALEERGYPQQLITVQGKL